jgi:hypothetical protein
VIRKLRLPSQPGETSSRAWEIGALTVCVVVTKIVLIAKCITWQARKLPLPKLLEHRHLEFPKVEAKVNFAFITADLQGLEFGAVYGFYPRELPIPGFLFHEGGI